MRRIPERFRWPLIAVLPLILLAAPVFVTDGIAVGAQDDVLRVEKSDRLSVRFSYSGDGQISWREHSTDNSGEILYEPDVAGFLNRGDVKEPLLPHRGAWLVVPPGTRPVLSIVGESWQRIAAKRLLVGATAIRLVDGETGDVYLGEELLLPGQSATRGRVVELPRDQRRGGAEKSSSDAVVLGQPAAWRGRTVVSLSLCPLRCNGEGVATSLLQTGTWEIRFEPDKSATPVAPVSRKITSHGDANFSFLFLNGDSALNWPTEAASSGLQASEKARSRAGKSDGTPLMAGEIRIPITRTRLSRVTASELIDRQLLPASGILESDIRLFQRRYIAGTDTLKVEVPIHMVGDGGDFSGSDFFVFYAMRLRDDLGFTGPQGEVPGCEDPKEMWNDANIYWLVASRPDAGQSWVRMDESTLLPSQGTPEGSYRRTDHFEEAFSYRQQANIHGQDRNMFNAYLDRDVSIPTMPFYAPDPTAATDCVMTLGTVGFSAMPDNRFVNVYLETGSGEPPETHFVATYNANTLAHTDRPFNVPAGWLAEQPISLLLNRDANYPLFSFLDYVKVTYDALYEAIEGTYFFDCGSNFNCGDIPGTRNIEVTGFISGDLGLIELTEPHLPVWINLAPANIQGTTLSVSVEQGDPVVRPRTFASFTDPEGAGIYPLSYSRLELVEVGEDPRATAGPVDLLVITHGDFLQSIDRWVQHRQSRSPGLVVRVVDVQDVYDWFGGGLKSAEIVKRMVVWAHDNWGAWALQIVGDANENVRNLGHLNASGSWHNTSEDWVPTYLYPAPSVIDAPEVLGSDKWYTIPGSISLVPSSMYVGRFPCHSASDLEGMIDKVIAMETSAPGQDWRRRAVFCTDDRWSYGYGSDVSQTNLEYSHGERTFQYAEANVAELWEAAGSGEQESNNVYLREFLCPHYNDCPAGSDTSVTRDTQDVLTYVETSVTPVLLSALQNGSLLFRFQGHGNSGVMAHENIFIDRPNMRRDVLSLNNADKAGVFMGYGCHLAEWMRNSNDYPSAVVEPCLSEKLVLHDGGGASAAYASCGYETISGNAAMTQAAANRWFVNPPVGSVAGDAVRSRWVLGELIWATEADYVTWGSRTLFNYNLFGDPLMVLDAGPPQAEAVLADAGDVVLSDGDELLAIDATGTRSIRMDAIDEAGIARIEVLDSLGEVVPIAVTETLPVGQTDHQHVTWEFDLPVEAFDHELEIRVYDSAWVDGDAQYYALDLSLPQGLTVYSHGEVVAENEFVFPNSSAQEFVMQVEASAWMADNVADLVVLGGTENLDLVLETVRRIDEHHLEIDFTAANTEEGLCALDLVIDGSRPTRFILCGSSAPEDEFTIGQLNSFPNPMVDGTRFIFKTSLGTADGRIMVYSLSGQPVAVIPIAESVAVGGQVVVRWDGRDTDGDELANGVYIYRAVLNSRAGELRSDMQRLVVMR